MGADAVTILKIGLLPTYVVRDVQFDVSAGVHLLDLAQDKPGIGESKN